MEPAKPEHRLASAADFRKRIKDEDCYEPPVYVILPKCGLEVLLRRPRPIAYTLFGEALPGIPERGTDAAPSAEGQPKISAEDAAHIARWLAELWGKVFVQPKLSLSPGFDEIHPDWIPEEDQRFIWRWIRAEVNDAGESLRTFPRNVQG